MQSNGNVHSRGGKNDNKLETQSEKRRKTEVEMCTQKEFDTCVKRVSVCVSRVDLNWNRFYG